MTLLLIQAAATLALVGLIWTIQLVHYSLWDGVGEDGWVEYHARHARWITVLVGPLMTTELVTSVLLFFQAPAGVDGTLLWIGMGLVWLVWGTTTVIFLPLHNKLSQAQDTALLRKLVRWNWIRTLAWTARGVLVLLMIQQAA